MALDDVSISPQQQAATQQIAQNVASSSGSSAPAAPPAAPAQQGPSILGRIAFAFGNLGTHGALLEQKLNSQYRQELQDREIANREKMIREQGQQQLIMQGIQSQGSAFLQNPKIQKMIGIDNLPLYQQIGKVVDAQNQMSAAAAKALGLPPGMEHLPKQALEFFNKQAQLRNQAAIAQQNNAVKMRGQDITAADSANSIAAANARNAATISAENARTAAQIASREALSGTDKQQAAFDKWTDSIGKQRDALIRQYSATDSSGEQKFTDKQRAAAAKAFNSSIDAKAKELKERGITGFDPEAYKVHADPTVPGSFFHWRKAEPGTLTASTPDTVAVPPTTGIGAANASITRPAAVPSDAVRKSYKGQVGWYSPSTKNFYPNA